MALAAFGIVFLIGAALSLRFKFLILFPAIGLVVFGIAAFGVAHGDRIGTVMLTIAWVAAALQIGYLFGGVTRARVVRAMNRRLAISLLAVALVPGAIGIAFAQAGGRGAGGVPNLDVRPSCRESTIPNCLSQEQIAREMLIKEWPRFTAQEKTRCAEEAKYAGPSSYVEWLTCLQINANDTTPGTGTGGETGSATRGGTSSATHEHQRPNEGASR
jgi:hypothetical protein